MDPFLYNVPKLDLHGCTRDIGVALVKEFIDDYSKIDEKKLLIIHGRGEGILRKSTHEYLKSDKRVKEYKIDNYNDGQTIVILK